MIFPTVTEWDLVGGTSSHQRSEPEKYLQPLTSESRVWVIGNVLLGANETENVIPSPSFHQCTYLIWLHGPFVQLGLILRSLTMKSHQHSYRSRRVEKRCAWDCGGTSPKDEPESPERTTRGEEKHPNAPAVGPAV